GRSNSFVRRETARNLPHAGATARKHGENRSRFRLTASSYCVEAGYLSGTTVEEQLVQRARDGDTEAFAALCERHRARVWRTVASVARGPAAEDLAQEAIVRAFCALHTYRAASSFEAWLCRIALNAAHDYQRSAWKRRVTFWDRTAGDDDAAGPVGESLENE